MVALSWHGPRALRWRSTCRASWPPAGLEPLAAAAELQLLGTALAVQHRANCDSSMVQAQLTGQQYNLRPRHPSPAALAATRRFDGAAAHVPHAALLQQQPSALPADVMAASEAALQRAEAQHGYSPTAAVGSASSRQAVFPSIHLAAPSDAARTNLMHAIRLPTRTGFPLDASSLPSASRYVGREQQVLGCAREATRRNRKRCRSAGTSLAG